MGLNFMLKALQYSFFNDPPSVYTDPNFTTCRWPAAALVVNTAVDTKSDIFYYVSRDPYEYWGMCHSFGKSYLIYIKAQVLENYFHTP